MFAIGPKSVDSVMSVFHRTIADLEQVAQEQQALVAQNQEAAKRAQQAAEAAKAEGERAQKVRSQLQSLLVP